MPEKIFIRRIKNGCDLLKPETHSIGASLINEYSSEYITAFPEHKADELGNFNIAARKVFEAYCSGRDLTPKKNQNLYSGKIAFIDTKHEDNKCRFGVAIYDVVDGTIPELCLQNASKDLRIEKNMTCSDLYKRVIDMYFYCFSSAFDKVMYAKC